MARSRSKRKFYPEFYTDEELESQNKNPDAADTDTSGADNAEKIESADNTESTESINDIQTETPMTENVETSTAEMRDIPSVAADTPSAPSASAQNNTESTRKTTKRSSKKVDLSSVDKNIPDNIKEKLYPSTRTGISKTSEAMFRQLDDMQRDYMQQKLAVASTEIPADFDVFEDDGSITDETVEASAVEAVEIEEMQNADRADIEESDESADENYTEEYNDYPFEDEPYKIMDAADIENAEPYNDNPYEDANYDDGAHEAIEVDDADDASDSEYIDTMESIAPMEIQEMPEIPGTMGIIAPRNITPFDRESAIKYAHRWALDRNPDYLDFDELGGDCTNYISQILLAGGCPMDRTPVFGWYYIDGNNKSPSWTGVEQLYKYLVKDKEFGIIAQEIELSEIEAGDIVQMSFNGKTFQHTPFIVSVTRNPDNSISYDNVRICAHSFDSENRPLDTYKWRNIRFIRILGHM